MRVLTKREMAIPNAAPKIPAAMKNPANCESIISLYFQNARDGRASRGRLSQSAWAMR